MFDNKLNAHKRIKTNILKSHYNFETEYNIVDQAYIHAKLVNHTMQHTILSHLN